MKYNGRTVFRCLLMILLACFVIMSILFTIDINDGLRERMSNFFLAPLMAVVGLFVWFYPCIELFLFKKERNKLEVARLVVVSVFLPLIGSVFLYVKKDF